MKVLFVIDGLGTGGAERSLAEMLPQLERRGVQSVVACLHRRTEGVQDQVLASGYDVRFLRGHRASRIQDLRGLIRSEHPSLMHTTIFESNLSGRVAAVGSGLPVVTSLVSTPYVPARSHDPNVAAWKLAVVKAVDGATSRHLTTAFHAISRAVKRAAVRDLRIDESRITVIPRGREPERLGRGSSGRRVAARRDLGLDGEGPVVVTVGRQEFQKGQWYLLEAMALLRAERPGVRLVIAGRRGNGSSRLEAVLRRTGLNGEVRFLGHRNDVPEVLAAADLFVFPSLFEGLGGALIEAMALGLPIVASDLPAIREVVEEGANALLVPPGSPGRLADAMRELLDDPARRAAFGAKGREIFEERFTIDRSVDRMVSLYERVVAEGRRG
jgi:glycosyltransferase involved in cell wall biosynthesis